MNFVKKHPVISLIILSPVLAELISGSTPVFKFFHPFGILLATGFYGLGAVLIREIAARKKLGYGSILLLGAAFGVLEEGILLKSWFDPHWGGAAALAKSLQIGGFIPFQALMLTFYHAVLSITIPILLVESLSFSKDSWLSNKKCVFLFLLFVFSSLVLSSFLGSKARILGWHFLLTLILFVGFIILAFKKQELKQKETHVFSKKLLVLGILFLPLLAVIFWFLSGFGVWWVIVALLSGGMFWYYRKIFKGIDWSSVSPKQYVALGVSFAAGTIPFSLLISFQNPVKFLNVFFAVIFTLIFIRVYRRMPSQPSSSAV